MSTTENLPPSVLEQLAKLKAELDEEEITQKGYDKRRAAILREWEEQQEAQVKPPSPMVLPITQEETSAETIATKEEAHTIPEATEQSLTGKTEELKPSLPPSPPPSALPKEEDMLLNNNDNLAGLLGELQPPSPPSTSFILSETQIISASPSVSPLQSPKMSTSSSARIPIPPIISSPPIQKVLIADDTNIQNPEVTDDQQSIYHQNFLSMLPTPADTPIVEETKLEGGGEIGEEIKVNDVQPTIMEGDELLELPVKPPHVRQVSFHKPHEILEGDELVPLTVGLPPVPTIEMSYSSSPTTEVRHPLSPVETNQYDSGHLLASEYNDNNGFDKRASILSLSGFPMPPEHNPYQQFGPPPSYSNYHISPTLDSTPVQRSKSVGPGNFAPPQQNSARMSIPPVPQHPGGSPQAPHMSLPPQRSSGHYQHPPQHTQTLPPTVTSGPTLRHVSSVPNMRPPLQQQHSPNPQGDLQVQGSRPPPLSPGQRPMMLPGPPVSNRPSMHQRPPPPSHQGFSHPPASGMMPGQGYYRPPPAGVPMQQRPLLPPGAGYGMLPPQQQQQQMSLPPSGVLPRDPSPRQSYIRPPGSFGPTGFRPPAPFNPNAPPLPFGNMNGNVNQVYRPPPQTPQHGYPMRPNPPVSTAIPHHGFQPSHTRSGSSAQDKDWDAASVHSTFTLPGPNSPYSAAARSRTFSVTSQSPMLYRGVGSIRRSSTVRAGSNSEQTFWQGGLRTVEPVQPPLHGISDFEQQELIDLAGRQMLPLEAREIPFTVMDPNGHTDLGEYTNLAAILRYRSTHTPRQQAFAVLDAKGKETAAFTWDKINSRAEKVAQVIRERSGLNYGDRVALVYRKSEILDFIVALFGTFLAGVVAVPINAADEMAELSFILSSTSSCLALTTDHNLRAFTKDLNQRGHEFPANTEWWKTNEFGSFYPPKGGSYPPFNPPDLAYIEYTKAPNGELKGVAISHRTIMSQCRAYKGAVTIPNERGERRVREREQMSENGTESSELSESGESTNRSHDHDHSADVLVMALEPRQQAGLILGILCGVYSGNFTVFLPSSALDHPAGWVNALTRYRATIAVADYSALLSALKSYRKEPSAVTNYSRRTQPDLSSLRYAFVDSIYVNTEWNRAIATGLLGPLGVEKPEDVLCPLLSLPEHGGMILSMRDYIGPARLEEVGVSGDRQSIVSEGGLENRNGVRVSDRYVRSVLAPGSSRDKFECLLDREALKMNRVVVLATGQEAHARKDERGVMAVGAFGFAMSETTIVIVDPENGAICPPDSVGEMWVDSPSLSGGFWALPKLTESIFHAKPLLIPPETLVPEYYDQEFLRTGLLGCIIGGRLIVLGLYEDRVRQQLDGAELSVEEYHYAPDLVRTVHRHVPLEASTCFEILINNQHLPVVVAETSRPDVDLPAMADLIAATLLDWHGVRIYAVTLCPSEALPRQYKNSKKVVHSMLCRKGFELGRLHARHIKIDVDRTVFDVAWGEDVENGVWKSTVAYEGALMRGEIGRGLPQHTGMEPVIEVIDERTGFDLTKFTNIIDMLIWRTVIHPEEIAYIHLEPKKEPKTLSWLKLNQRIACVANFIEKRGVKPGDHVLIIFPPGFDFVVSVHACLVLGAIPVPLQDPDQSRLKEDMPALFGIITELKISYIMGNTATDDMFKAKPLQAFIKTFSGRFPEIVNVTKAPKYTKSLGKESGYMIAKEWLDRNRHALVLVHYTPDMRRYCVRLAHETILAQCRTQKVTCQMQSQRGLVSCVRTYNGLGFLQGVMCGIYVGCPTVIISPQDYHATPQMFFEAIQQYKVKDSFSTYPMLQHAMSNMPRGDWRNFSLHNLQNLMIATDGRPRPEFYHHVFKYFQQNRLEGVAINSVYSHIINPMVATRSYMLMEPITLHLDLARLRQGLVRPVSHGEDPRLRVVVQDSGIVPSTTMIAIVNPETRTICPPHVIGEIWVCSDSNVRSTGDPTLGVDHARLAATVENGDPRLTYARTGDLGFLWNVRRNVDDMSHSVEEGQCLFVLGTIVETFEVNGLMHFPSDVERTVEKCHPNIASEGCIVFQGASLEVVAVVQVKSTKYAMPLVPVVVNAILDEHQFLVDVVITVAPNHLLKSRIGEKQRIKTLAAYMAHELEILHEHRITGTMPIHVEEPEALDEPSEAESRRLSGHTITQSDVLRSSLDNGGTK